jgi:hypothetical protein
MYRQSAMMLPADRRRAVAVVARAGLVPAGAFAVHELRFILAYGGGTSAELARSGHSYLHSLVPWIVGLIGVAVGCFLWGCGRALAGQRSAPRYTLSLAALWLLCTACLLSIYVAQETLEGMFAIGHAAGWTGIFGYGGWWAVPAAACVGLVLAAAFHGARWTLDEIARRVGGRPRVRARRSGAARRPAESWQPVPLPLADGSSGRGPPAVARALAA